MVYVHLGYPKTATTTFQQHVFPRQSDIVYLGKLIPSFRYTDPDLYVLIDELMTASSINYAGAGALQACIQRHREASAGRPLLVSSESFLHVTAADPGLVAGRVREAFGPCKVIITIREQRSLLRSLYGMHGRFGQYLFVLKPELEPFELPLSIAYWLELLFRAAERNFLALLQYDTLIGHYRELLGDENVGVFLFEEFKAEPHAYIARLAGFLGCDAEQMFSLARGRHEHAALAQTELAWWRLRRWLGKHTALDTAERRLHSRWAKLLSYGPTVRDSIPESWDRRLQDYYAAGNTRLAARLNQPLGRYGYAICD